ncbi:MAG: signal peptidase I [Fluviicola sp.]|nr:MAG: signal peptidase I [Fluviicola sp.]
MNVFYFYLFILAHPYLAMWWKSFEQADRKSWEALIPIYNYYVAFKIGSRKPFWCLLLVFPGVHLVMWATANVSYIRRFGYFTFVDTLQGIFFPYIIMFKIAQSKDKMLPETNWANSAELGRREWGDHLILFLCLPFIGHAIALGIAAVTRAEPGKKTKTKEWGDALLFALVAASIIRTYVFEPFQIPTGSMEKTLLVGDFLFVNKLAYGPKVPVTPISYPLVHNTVPWVNVKSYVGLETSDYTRLPGFTEVNRYDVVVFNYPSGDTAIYDPRMPMGLMGHDYHGYVLSESYYLFRNDPEVQRKTNKIYAFYSDSVATSNQALPDSLQMDANQTQELIFRLTSSRRDKMYVPNIDSWKSKARKFIAGGQTHLDYGKDSPQADHELIEHYGIIPRPVDKRENYIKRCVGIPGDFIEVKNSVLYVNDKKAPIFEFSNLEYIVDNVEFNANFMEEIGMELDRRDYQKRQLPDNKFNYHMHATKNQLAQIKAKYPEAKVEVYLEPKPSSAPNYVLSYSDLVNNTRMYPKDLYVENTRTNFSRFQIPKKGLKIELTVSNLAWYRRVITAYEGHSLVVKKDGTVMIDGKKATSYTFAMNYYWMMGDNRYNSVDSRVWGFVPEDHIVGKASMVWFSKNPYGGVRWDRLFTGIK